MVKIKPQKKGLCFDGTKVEQFLDFYELAAQLDGASEYDMARQLGCFVQEGEILMILATLEGYKPPNWPKLRAAMIAYWGDVDKALFTERDLDALVDLWVAKGGVSSVSEYQAFRKSWEPIQSYLEKAMVTTLDKRFRLPSFEVLKSAVTAVMETQTALTFEDSRISNPVPGPFKAANDTMLKMEADRRPKDAPVQPQTPATVDDLSRMLQSFEQRLKKELLGSAPASAAPAGSRPPLVCFYCHREGHGTARCFELKKDKEEKLVEQRGNDFFLPNGALIPRDNSARSDMSWRLSSQSFSGFYQSDPARKRHEAPKPFKAPAVPPSVAKRPVKKKPTSGSDSEGEEMGAEPELFERSPARPSLSAEPTEPVPSTPASKPESTQPRVRFERGIAKHHPHAFEGVIKKISDLPVTNLTVSEILAISPAVADGMKKWVSRRRCGGPSCGQLLIFVWNFPLRNLVYSALKPCLFRSETLSIPLRHRRGPIFRCLFRLKRSVQQRGTGEVEVSPLQLSSTSEALRIKTSSPLREPPPSFLFVRSAVSVVMAEVGGDPRPAKMKKIKPQEGLKFDGSNIERFLADYELAAELDEASDYDKARQIVRFVENGETRAVLETLEGNSPPNWSKLKAAMLSYWADVDTALFTERDIAWDPIQAYLVSKGHIESDEELKKQFYQAFSVGFQARIRDQMIKESTLIVTADNRARLPAFKVLRAAVDTVMKGQISLTFEDTQSAAPVASPFQEANDILKKMGAERRPVAETSAPKPENFYGGAHKDVQGLRAIHEGRKP
ncbi:hypothetical protein PTTG_29772 [Puccinia triticina 1-1 BBBD Race 1]|uniref:CCHC-type domain-containing protein n=1 Tax=Puccinia triticina (isolate 1-1 / race 1 (BBBD)) TaxID=630390 RepID=A0A180G1W6_PUCT1|nr:hypothetical protein PTTG_29772 [Puccinia triticina 1-1 BBBD Race 1]